jgi:hypothetical protein
MYVCVVLDVYECKCVFSPPLFAGHNTDSDTDTDTDTGTQTQAQAQIQTQALAHRHRHTRTQTKTRHTLAEIARWAATRKTKSEAHCNLSSVPLPFLAV